MPLHPLYGHDRLRNQLEQALVSGKLPQALLFDGPRGVGKQRLALWLAQAILCQGEREAGVAAACGQCQSCRLVGTLSHPDLHWFVPIEMPKRDADSDKQVELAAEALGEVMAARREQPLYEAPSGMASHPIAAVRLLLRRIALKPALGEGRRKVILVGDAERLVPQRGAEAAANALLKALEEPPADTTFLLTSTNPDALLPTILSRVVRVRVNRVQDSVVTSFVQNAQENSGSPQEIARKVALADGCIGKLLAPETSQRDAPETAGIMKESVRQGAVARYAYALGRPPFEARGAFTEMLDGLLEQFRADARAGSDTRQVVAAIARVFEAREQAQGNVNPQLLTAVLADDLAAGGRSAA